MKIKVVLRKRSLTTFNNGLGKKGSSLPHYPVLIYVRDRGKSYYINTGLVTSNLNMEGDVFTDIDCTKVVNRLKTQTLQNMIDACEEHMYRNTRLSFDAMKSQLTAIIQQKSVAEVQRGKHKKSLADYMYEFAKTKKSEGTRNLYKTTANRLVKHDPDATFETITIDWLEEFVSTLYDEGLTCNGIAIYLRNIKALMNWAIKHGVTENNVFRRFTIEQEKTSHLVLDWQELADFRDYPCEPWQEVYRDMSMLSFYLCGINVGDLMMLQQIIRGRCEYDRQKTGAHGNVAVIDEAMAIIEKYRGEECLLSVMDGRADYHSFGNAWNKALKKIGWSRIVKDKVGKLRKIEYHPMFKGMTTYTFRRTFATLASDLDIPKETIGQCLTHSWTDVTERYITRSPRKVDECVRKVVEHLNTFKGRSKEVIDEEIRKRDRVK